MDRYLFMKTCNPLPFTTFDHLGSLTYTPDDGGGGGSNTDTDTDTATVASATLATNFHETTASFEFIHDTHTRLPPELLLQITSYLSRSDQRRCLFVSRYIHDIVIQHLFRAIYISLGEWVHCRALEWWAPPQPTNRSWELLYHIAFDPEFASNVKHVVVGVDDGVGLENVDLSGCACLCFCFCC